MADDLTRGALETLTRLRRRGLISPSCPPANDCRCPECWDGRRQGTLRLRVVTMPTDTAPEHDPSSFTCPCQRCETDRQTAAHRAKQRIRQPWETRHAA